MFSHLLVLTPGKPPPTGPCLCLLGFFVCRFLFSVLIFLSIFFSAEDIEAMLFPARELGTVVPVYLALLSAFSHDTG